MFNDDYKKEIENIKADEYIKEKVRTKLKEAEKPRKNIVKFNIYKTVAAVICLALVASIATVLAKNNDLFKSNTVKSRDYQSIYKKLEQTKTSLYTNEKVLTVDGAMETTVDTSAFTAKTANAATAANESHSETNIQVDGVDESDIVKTDGKYIYILNDSEEIIIVDVAGGKAPRQIADIEIDEDLYASEMYITENRIAVLCQDYSKRLSETAKVLIYDISNPEKPKELKSCTQNGGINSSRLIGNKLYLITNYYVYMGNIKEKDVDSYIPTVNCKNHTGTVTADTIYLYENCMRPEYTILTAFNIENSAMVSTQSVLGGTQTVYSSTDNIITAARESGSKTQIMRFGIKGGKIRYKAAAQLDGYLLNQFSIDEYKNHFRFVLTQNKQTAKSFTTVNSLLVLDKNLKTTGKIANIAKDERVYSVRFMGDTAYFVTFRQVDPLFSADLSDPKNPKIIGALKIPGFSDFLFPYGDGKLLGIGKNADEDTGKTGNIKLSLFDISDPKNVTESDKTDIPAIDSSALYNHKAILVDKAKNLIAFAATDYGDYDAREYFFVYSYQNGKFVNKLKANVDEDAEFCRGAYIGNTFYVVTDENIDYYNIENFSKIGSVELD